MPSWNKSTESTELLAVIKNECAEAFEFAWAKYQHAKFDEHSYAPKNYKCQRQTLRPISNKL